MKFRYLASISCMLILSGASTVARSETPVFPIVLGQAVTESNIAAKSEKIIYTQPFTPQSVVKTTTEITTKLHSHKPLSDVSQTVTIPAGTLLVKAYFRHKPAYCTSYEQTRATFLQGTYFEGLCLSDDDGAGHFIHATYLTPSGRVEGPVTPYEIFDERNNPETEKVLVGYISVPVDAEFQSTIQLKEERSNGHSFEILTEIHYADVLMKKSKKTSPDTILWSDQLSDFSLTSSAQPTEISIKEGVGKVEFGSEIAADATHEDGKDITLSWSKTLPKGEQLITLVGTTQTIPSIYVPMDVFILKLHSEEDTDTAAKGPQ